jgi:cell division protein ZapA (FtsZ GTPase activity inhibitor)
MQITILNRQFTIACTQAEERRIEDLARALNARLEGCSEPDALSRVVFTALSLMDEIQTTHAALARSHCEIERLTDMVVEAKLEAEAAQTAPDTPDRGRVSSLRRVAEGAA